MYPLGMQIGTERVDFLCRFLNGISVGPGALTGPRCRGGYYPPAGRHMGGPLRGVINGRCAM